MRNFPLDFQKMATVRNSLLGIPSLAAHFQRIHPRQFRSRSLSRPVELLIYWAIFDSGRLPPIDSSSQLPARSAHAAGSMLFSSSTRNPFLRPMATSASPATSSGVLVPRHSVPTAFGSDFSLRFGVRYRPVSHSIALALRSAGPAVPLLVLALTWLTYHQVVTRNESTTNLGEPSRCRLRSAFLPRSRTCPEHAHI
jgi:hypothetical protein